MVSHKSFRWNPFRGSSMSGRVALFILIILALITSSSAINYPPEKYWGQVYLDESLAPDGTNVRVMTSSDEILGEFQTPYFENETGSYSFTLPFDDPSTSEDEGAEEGESLVWEIDGVVAYDPDAGEDTASVARVNRDYEIRSFTNPSLNLRIENPTKIDFGSWTSIDLIFNNGAEGEAEVSISVEDDGLRYRDIDDFEIEGNEEKTIALEVFPERCGEYEPSVQVDYYNRRGDLVDSIENFFEMEAVSPDIRVVSVTYRNKTEVEGTDMLYRIVLRNDGAVEASNFFIDVYDNGNLIDSINDYSDLESGEIIVKEYVYRTSERVGIHNLEFVPSTENACTPDQPGYLLRGIEIVPNRPLTKDYEEKEMVMKMDNKPENESENKNRSSAQPITSFAILDIIGLSTNKWILLGALLLILAFILVWRFQKKNKVDLDVKFDDKGRKIKKGLSEGDEDESIDSEKIRKVIEKNAVGTKKAEEFSPSMAGSRIPKMEIKSKGFDNETDNMKPRETGNSSFLKHTISSSSESVKGSDLYGTKKKEREFEQYKFLPYDYLQKSINVLKELMMFPDLKEPILDKYKKKGYEQIVLDLASNAAFVEEPMDGNLKLNERRDIISKDELMGKLRVFKYKNKR